jgi:thiol:disulfide interchange protein DsbD
MQGQTAPNPAPNRVSRILLIALALAAATALVPAVMPTGPQSGLDASGLLESGQLWMAAGLIFLGGLLTSLTPCVYPLIPITVSVFGARQAESKAKAVLLTSAYVIGMGVVFSTLGVVAALSGKAFGSALGDPFVVGGLAVFLLVLASSMFGAFDLELPSGLATKLNHVGGGGLVGALLMGSVSGFLAAPCTGPVLTGVLAFVAKSQNPVLGGALLFAYALGIGVPFFLLGVFTVRLPKGGVWMEWVKSFFGVALVALALSYLRDAFFPLRSALVEAARWLGEAPGVVLASGMVLAGVLLGAIHRSFKEGARDAVPKAIGVTMIALAVLLRGAASDAPKVGGLLASFGFVPSPDAVSEVHWHVNFPVRMRSGAGPFEEALARAKAEGKPVMIDFFAEWCAACKELDRHTYVAGPVVQESTRFLNIKVDGTEPDDIIEELYARYGVSGLPTVAFIDSKGELLVDPRVTGFLDAASFHELQKKVR